MTDAMEQLVILEHHQTLAGPLDYREENLERLADLGNELRMLRWQTTSAAKRNGLTPERWDQAREGWLEQTENDLNKQLIQDPDWQERFKEAQDLWIQSAENYTSLARDATTGRPELPLGIIPQSHIQRPTGSTQRGGNTGATPGIDKLGQPPHRGDGTTGGTPKGNKQDGMGWDTIDSERQEDLKRKYRGE